MKIDARIKWNINVPELGITVGKIETTAVDIDYVEEKADIVEYVENELAMKYGRSFYACQADFAIENIYELVEEVQAIDDEL